MRFLGFHRDRSADIRKVAATLGFSYVEKFSDSELKRFESLPLAQSNLGALDASPKMTNVITGTRVDLSIVVADYEVITTGPTYGLLQVGSAAAHDQNMARLVGSPTVVIFPREVGVEGPSDFYLDPETSANKPLWKGLDNIIGWEDIDFEGSNAREVFSSRYRLRGNKEETLRKEFNDELIEFFVDHLGWSIQASSECIAIWRGRSVVRADAIVDLCDETTAIYRVLMK